MTEPNKHPVIFLFLEMPPEGFDVNVHPTKTEVRFDNANGIHSQVLSALREKLLSCDFQTAGYIPGGPSSSVSSENPLEDLLQKGRAGRIREAMEDFFRDHASSKTPQRKFEFSAGHQITSGSPLRKQSSESEMDFPRQPVGPVAWSADP